MAIKTDQIIVQKAGSRIPAILETTQEGDFLFNDSRIAPIIASSVGAAYVIDSDGKEQKYSTLSSALASITDADEDNRKLVVLQGNITETATVTPKDYVDVCFKPGTVLNCNSMVSQAKGLVFTGLNSCHWYAEIPHTAEIRRGGAAGDRNYVVDITSPTSGYLEFDGLIFRNVTHATARNYGFHNAVDANIIMRNCHIYGAGTDRAYGCVMSGSSFIYDTHAFGGDNTIGGTGGLVAVGWVMNSSAGSNVKYYRCYGYGGNAGTGTEAYGWWVFSYGGQGSDQAFTYMEDCVGIGGIASAFTDGINGHISATAHLVRCVGIGGDNGHGIGIYGTVLNFARFVLDDCIGICRNTNAASTDWHGLSVGATDRSRYNGGAYYGSPFVENSCGIRLNQDTAKSGGTSADTAIAEFHRVSFYGGGTGMEGQSLTTQQTGCHGLKVVESEVGARFIECLFIGNDESAGIQVDNTANPATLTFSGGAAYSTDSASNVAINSASAWNDANVFLMLLPGGVTNVTPAAGTPLGTNIEI